jgi:hypothetical protein
MSESTPRKKKQVTPKVIMKNQKEMRHDVFKSDIQNFMENTSFTRDDPTIVQREHTHIYHTIDSQCRTLQYTNAVGGHFHKVTIEMNEDGELVAKCSEPLKYHFRRLPRGGFKKEIGPVSWFDGNNNRTIADNHVHELIYQHSEMINVDSARKIRSSAAQNQMQDQDGLKDMDR